MRKAGGQYIVNSSSGPHGVTRNWGPACRYARELATGRGESVSVCRWPSGKPLARFDKRGRRQPTA